MTYDAWLSSLLGKAAYHVAPDVTNITETGFYDSKANLMSQVGALARLGFDPIVTEVALERRPIASIMEKTKTPTRAATPADQAAVKLIAGKTFSFDRFHRDPKIGKAVADEIKRQWVGNFFDGKRGTHMIVVERDGKVVGFSQCICRDGVLITDLMGVDPAYLGRGAGRDLMRGALTTIEHKVARVGTQIDNLASLALYTSLGYRMMDSRVVCHYHR